MNEENLKENKEEKQRSNNFYILALLQNKIPDQKQNILIKALQNSTKEEQDKLMLINFKNPMIGLFLGLIPAFLLSGLSLDRIYKKDIMLESFKIILWLLSWVLLLAGVASYALNETALGEIIFLGGFVGLVALFIWNAVNFFLVFKGIKEDNLIKILKVLERK